MKLTALIVGNSLLALVVFALVLTIKPIKAHAQGFYDDFDKRFEQTSQLIVMLNVEYAGSLEYGAGIIFGRDQDRLLIVTAYHILHRGALQPRSILVKLRDKPEKFLKATLLRSDDEMDLAVLSVENGTKQGNCALPFKRLGGWQTGFYRLQRGNEVYPVGNPNGVSWTMPVAPDFIAQINGNEIIFQSAFISLGHSGGGLIDVRADLIGMTIADQPPYGRALSMPAILGKVRDWKFPVELDTSLLPYKETPLHLAAEKGDTRLIHQLLSACADPNAQDREMRTPLHLAAAAGRIDAIKLLLKGGAKLTVYDQLFMFPLTWAVFNGQVEAVSVLLKAGADPDPKFGKDYIRRPLKIAVEKGHIEILKLLVEAGADINARDQTGETALSLALSKQNKTVIELLQSYGAKK